MANLTQNQIRLLRELDFYRGSLIIWWHANRADYAILEQGGYINAQDIYRAAFNNAYENHAHNPIEEADAHNIAWAAVERSYVKEGGEWVPRGVPG